MLRVDTPHSPPPTPSISLTTSEGPRPLRTGHQNVLSRLQALLPSPSSPLPPHTLSLDTTNAPVIPPPPKFLKVRIMTWNMHESLPKGDLEELLGAPPPYSPTIPLHDPAAFPYLPYDGEHPYHLVVVAGQECPSLSGLPMGLGAGFKLKDKEKEKEKERVKEKDKDGREKGEKEKEQEKERENERYKENLKELHHRLLKQREWDNEEHNHNHSSGWTSILEDWFCHGIRDIGASAKPPSRLDSPFLKEGLKDVDRAFSEADIKKRPTTKGIEHRKGPYEMLVKERMMGIYLAIFVHRDARHLVKGTSRSAVTAGLVGGRVGNKGGVGISLNIAGRTMLFLNAHLAAHEGKVLSRMANLRKIKAELSLDAFLAPDDPRMLSEDLTDKFDYTFLCGDLNFRLDISRLHADWLISRKEYAQALTFDQLYNIMRNGQAFVGFREAPIDFPPTFKYDVLRTLKSKRKHSKPHNRPFMEEAHEEIHEEEIRDANDQEGIPDNVIDDKDSSDDEDMVGESASAVSTGTTFSKKTTPDQDSSDSDSDVFMTSPDKASRGHIGARDLVKRISVTAARKARVKLHELLSPTQSPAARPTQKWPRNKSHASMADFDAQSRHLPTSASLYGDIASSQPAFVESGKASEGDSLAQSPSPAMIRASSTKSGVHSSTYDGDEDGDKGVYDSSSKQRVPSWCDRILWKSTVKPDPDPEMDSHLPHARTLVGHFTSAWRQLSSRRPSISSLRSHESHSSPSPFSPGGDLPPISSPMSFTSSPTPSPSAASPPPRNSRPRSTEFTADRPKPLMTRSQSSMALSQLASAHLHLGPPPKHPSASVPVRASTAPAPPLSPGTPSHPQPPSSPNSSGESSPFNTPSRWRFLPFLSREHTEHKDIIPQHPVVPPRPRKGDVICLNYQTLDDRGMRRLEGRSDHRPVIGSYAVYI
ncbi:DNase I-like protein [Dentipellis sp. KUC8613]|nr:DNase I-like protein [Dentipellis sp. KUC8613]